MAKAIRKQKTMTLVVRVPIATIRALDDLANELSTPQNPRTRSDAARTAIEAGIDDVNRRTI